MKPSLPHGIIRPVVDHRTRRFRRLRSCYVSPAPFVRDAQTASWGAGVTHMAMHIMSCDGQRAKVELKKQSEAESASGSWQMRLSVVDDNRPLNLSIIHDESVTLTCLARGECIASKVYGAAISDQSHLALCADNFGRLLTVDLRAQRVTLF